MKLSNLLADAMMNGNTEMVLTAVGDALAEVMERNSVNSKTADNATELNKPYNQAGVLVFQARNLFRS